MENEKTNLTILLLLSFLLSTYLFFRTYVISIDGAFQYIPIAKDLASGFFRKALSHNQQPLYSLIVAFVSGLVSDFELAGKLVSSFFGILLIFPVYFLGKRIFDQKIAFFSALFWVIHPYVRRFSADVLKESTYLFFLATATWFVWKVIQGERKYPYLFIPLFSALTYLVRPDGFEVLVVVFVYTLFIKKFSLSKEKWTVILLLTLSSALLFLPYLVHLQETTGVWTLSRAKTITWFLGMSGSASEISLIDRLLFTIKNLNSEIFSTYHSLYVFFLAIGLWKGRTSLFKGGAGFLLLFCFLHYLILFLLVLNITEWSGEETVRAVNFSGRHVLPLLLFSVYWVGVGFLIVNHWVYNKIESLQSFFPIGSERKSVFVLITLLTLVLAIVLPKTLKPQRCERLPEKWAGVWIRNQYGKGTTIFTSAHRVAYYADGNLEYVDIKKDTIDKIRTMMGEKKALHLVIREKESAYFPEHEIKKNFAKVNRFEGKGMEKIILYKRIQ